MLSITHHTRKRPSTGPRTTHGPHMALGIQIQNYVPYVHNQNGLAKSLIKRIKLIA
jgi:hypothetical protein